MSRLEFLKLFDYSAQVSDGVRSLSCLEEGSGQSQLYGGRVLRCSEEDLWLGADQVIIRCKLENLCLVGSNGDPVSEYGKPYKAIEALKPGDWVELNLQEFYFQENHLNIKKGTVRLLSPSHEEPQLIKTSHLKDFSRFIFLCHKYFQKEDFVHLVTPSLVKTPALEPHLESFSTDWKLDNRSQKMYLPTSPELHLKGALSLGVGPQIYEIAKVFRSGELSPSHEPDFMMLEWYETFQPLPVLSRRLKGLILFLFEEGLFKVKKPSFEVFQLSTLFRSQIGVDLLPTGEQKSLRAFAKQQGLSESLSDEELFHLIFLNYIEPLLQEGCFVTHYPQFQSALARVDKQGWALRTEFYWRDFEIANGFEELLDPVENQNRMKVQDPQWEKSLRLGLPPASGMALGLERLFMAAFDLSRISQCRLFSKHENQNII